MPGPVSDSYNPEFGTSANADDVKQEMKELVSAIGLYLGPELKYIVGVVQGPKGRKYELSLSEKQLRVIRFGLNRAMESI